MSLPSLPFSMISMISLSSNMYIVTLSGKVIVSTNPFIDCSTLKACGFSFFRMLQTKVESFLDNPFNSLLVCACVQLATSSTINNVRYLIEEKGKTPEGVMLDRHGFRFATSFLFDRFFRCNEVPGLIEVFEVSSFHLT